MVYIVINGKGSSIWTMFLIMKTFKISPTGASLISGPSTVVAVVAVVVVVVFVVFRITLWEHTY